MVPYVVLFPLHKSKPRQELLAHELEHAADMLLDLLPELDGKTASRLHKLSVLFGVFAMVLPGFMVANLASHSELSIAALPVWIMAMFGEQVVLSRFHKTQHEGRANAAQKTVAKLMRESLSKVFSPK